MFCQKCGKENEDGSQFCLYCGAALVPSNNTALNNNVMMSNDEVTKKKEEKMVDYSSGIVRMHSWVAVYVFDRWERN